VPHHPSILALGGQRRALARRGAFSPGAGPSDSASTGSGDPSRGRAPPAPRAAAAAARDGLSAYAANLRPLARGAPSPGSRLAADADPDPGQGPGGAPLAAAAVLEEFQRARRYVGRHGEAALTPEQLDLLQVPTERSVG
jgi:hypothetical protein